MSNTTPNLPIHTQHLGPLQYFYQALAGLLLSALSLSVWAETHAVFVVQGTESPQTLEIDGTLEAVRQATIAAQVAGAVTWVQIQAGQSVQAGQLLLSLEGDSALQTRQAAQARSQESRAELALAQAEFQRRKALFEQQYISKAAYEQARARYTQAQAQLSAQQAQAQAAASQSDHYTLLAPYSGLIAQLYAHQGDMVMPGQVLATLFDPDALRIQAYIPQRYISQLAPQARIVWPAGTTGLPKTLPIQILPERHSASLTGTIRLSLPAHSTGLAPGTPIRIQIELLDTQQKRLWIPNTAVVHRTGLRGVYVLSAGGSSPRLRQVHLGSVSGDQVEVLAGLQTGERVILDASRIQHGN